MVKDVHKIYYFKCLFVLYNNHHQSFLESLHLDGRLQKPTGFLSASQRESFCNFGTAERLEVGDPLHSLPWKPWRGGSKRQITGSGHIPPCCAETDRPPKWPVCFLIFHGPALCLAQKDTLEATTLVILSNTHKDKAGGMSTLSCQANYDLSFLSIPLCVRLCVI